MDSDAIAVLNETVVRRCKRATSVPRSEPSESNLLSEEFKDVAVKAALDARVRAAQGLSHRERVSFSGVQERKHRLALS